MSQPSSTAVEPQLSYDPALPISAHVDQIAGLRPRRIAYVACDPAALARDLASFARHDYSVTNIKGFDLFPMTHHVECVATLEPTR